MNAMNNFMFNDLNGILLDVFGNHLSVTKSILSERDNKQHQND